ncbi:MAG: molybdenum cofactor guanylyltransferase [Robiginitomaculum sp.]
MNNSGKYNEQYGIILAGGQSRRMGRDKGAVKLSGARMVDVVIARFGPQCADLSLSASHDYGCGLESFPDREDGPQGPVAGLYAAYHWLKARGYAGLGFYAVPVDGPLLPDDFTARIFSAGHSAIATDGRVHPAFGWWRMEDLARAWELLDFETSISLHKLAEICHAQEASWPVLEGGNSPFININNAADLEAYLAPKQ